MNRFVISSIAVLGFVGVAAAQQAPNLQGNYSPDVLDQFNGTAAEAIVNLDFSKTASIAKPVTAPVASPSANADQNHGR